MGTESLQSHCCRKHALRHRRSPVGAAPTSLPRGHLGPSGLPARPARSRGSPAATCPFSADTARVTFGTGYGWRQLGRVSGLDPLSRGITTPAAGGSRRRRKRSGSQRPVPSARGPPCPCLGLESGYRWRPRADPFHSLTFLSPVGVARTGGCRRRRVGTPRAACVRTSPGSSPRACKPPVQSVGTAGHRRPALQGFPVPLLPSPGQAPPPQARPGRCFPQSQAETPRPFPLGMRRGGLRTSRHRLPQLQGPRAAPAPCPFPECVPCCRSA
ncbi:uncharacterized protein LOC128932587 [Callithrix jacchus]